MQRRRGGDIHMEVEGLHLKRRGSEIKEERRGVDPTILVEIQNKENHLVAIFISVRHYCMNTTSVHGQIV